MLVDLGRKMSNCKRFPRQVNQLVFLHISTLNYHRVETNLLAELNTVDAPRSIVSGSTVEFSTARCQLSPSCIEFGFVDVLNLFVYTFFSTN